MFKRIVVLEDFLGNGGQIRVVEIVDSAFSLFISVDTISYWGKLLTKLNEVYVGRGYAVALNLARFYSYYIRTENLGPPAIHHIPLMVSAWTPEPYRSCVIRRLKEEFCNV